MRSVLNIYLLFPLQPVITDGFVACTRSGRHLTLSLSRRCRRPCLSVSVSQLVLSPLVWVTPLYIVNATSASPPRPRLQHHTSRPVTWTMALELAGYAGGKVVWRLFGSIRVLPVNTRPVVWQWHNAVLVFLRPSGASDVRSSVWRTPASRYRVLISSSNVSPVVLCSLVDIVGTCRVDRKVDVDN